MSFGAWLWKNRHDNDDTLLLYGVADGIGPDWPIASSNRRDYERLIKRALTSVNQAEALQAVQNVWPSYEEDMQRDPTGNTRKSFMDSVFDVKNLMGLLCIGLFIFVYAVFKPELLSSLADSATSRGVIAFLIAIATVGIAVITVVNSFLGSGTKEDLAERFRQGKDVLKVLIGVLGTIVGFYFAQAQGKTTTPETTATASAPTLPKPSLPPPGTPTEGTPPKGTPPEGTPRP